MGLRPQRDVERFHGTLSAFMGFVVYIALVRCLLALSYADGDGAPALHRIDLGYVNERARVAAARGSSGCAPRPDRPKVMPMALSPERLIRTPLSSSNLDLRSSSC